MAVAAERDTVDLKKTQYMVPFIGEVFEGKISSITSFGMFVELDNGIDGLVHMNMMTDDYYFYDEEHFLLVGKRTGQIYHLGDTVTVTLVKADVEKRQIDFVLGEVDNLMRIQEIMKNSEGYVGAREKKPFGRSGISKQLKRRGKGQSKSSKTRDKGSNTSGPKKSKKGRKDSKKKVKKRKR